MEVFGRYAVLLVLILVAALQREAFGKKHNVEWDESTDFKSWASAQTFKVGDELVFKYTPGLHSVVELANESALKSCDIGTSLNSFNGGSDTVKLSKPGPRYFACGTSGHCEQGMKVKITTVAADSTGGGGGGGGTATTPPGDAQSTSASSAEFQLLSLFALIGSLVASLALLI